MVDLFQHKFLCKHSQKIYPKNNVQIRDKAIIFTRLKEGNLMNILILNSGNNLDVVIEQLQQQ